MKFFKIEVIVLLVYLMSPQKNRAQVTGTPYIPPPYVPCTTAGTDFWVSFGKNFIYDNAASLLLRLNISAGVTTKVTLNFMANGTTTDYMIPGGTVLPIDLNAVVGGTAAGDRRSNVYLSLPNVNTGASATPFISSNTLHITSERPISVYAFNTGIQTTDATILFPVSAWGKEYYRLSYVPLNYDPDQYDCEMIIADEDSTKLFLNGSATPFTTLNKGQVYYNPSNADLTGRYITSSNPVAYFSHVSTALVPALRNFADILYEQMPPVNQWGKRFLVPNALQEGLNTPNNHIRIIASQETTTVHYSGATLVTGLGTPIADNGILNKGQWFELEIGGTATTGKCFIQTDKPVGVAAYMVGGNDDNNTYIPPNPPPSYGYGGDPSIAWVPSLSQTIPSVTISPFLFPANSSPNTQLDAASAKHYMLIVTPTNTKEITQVNGGQLGAAGWIDDAESGYSYYRWDFNNTNDINEPFVVSNYNGVLVFCGGFVFKETYYYNAGSGTCEINQ
ncbi:IgGFc-binding protein [Fluviicola sp.]|jgi:hypothetical protein|uniref:IgGFc-binding protein n=1 Tax=Fluviicola sp. TaxID=1917219 RepID=UPI002831F809|nr:IgGFc-binding protein [Fluviicola sp.]MDR0802797.1 IgGFc-binding protein [Fluviicola sp.]